MANKGFKLGGLGAGSSPCCCVSGCTAKICLLNTCGGVATSVPITVTKGAFSYSGTSDPITGCMTFTIPAAGSGYTVTTTGAGRYANSSNSVSLTCGGASTNITLGPKSGYVCGCFAEPIPTTLSYTLDGQTGTITLVSGSASLSLCAPQTIITYPATQCTSFLAANPCTIAAGSAQAQFLFNFTSTCQIIQKFWCGTDCTDLATSGCTHQPIYIASSCAHFAPNFIATTTCDCIWLFTGGIGRFGQTGLVQIGPTLGPGLPTPVNISVTFSVPSGTCGPVFTNLLLTE
jgi:hypothetical protein